MALKYQRILLKISGEALGGEKGMGFDEPTMDAICGGVKKAHDLGQVIDHHKSDQGIQKPVTASHKPAQPSAYSHKNHLNKVPKFLHARILLP